MAICDTAHILAGTHVLASASSMVKRQPRSTHNMPAARFIASWTLRWWLLPTAVVLLSACGGSRDGGTPAPSGPMVTISGAITFDRIGFKATKNAGLDANNPIESPARGIVVEALNTSTSAIIATTATDASGNYSLQVPASTSVRIRAKAQMLQSGTPSWNFRVLNNTNGNALYVLDGAAADSGTADSTRNLKAATGWGGSSYSGARSAAPFAILDTVYRSKELVLAAQASASFPALDLYWSTTNKPAQTPFCTTSGDIGSTFYTVGSNGQPAGNCTSSGPLSAGIYVLGDFTQGDTDEFDQHVIAHEFGHYIEDKFSRSDSIGGDHGLGDRLDLRLAFSEGWGNAFSGMTLNDPLYRDSGSGVSSDFNFDMETDTTIVNGGAEGWFAEFSVQEILWDIFDNTADGESVSLGFAPMFTVMSSGQKNTEALTSIYSFATALRAANSSSSAAIASLLGNESIFGLDAFGTNETNNGGDTGAVGDGVGALPVYRSISANSPVLVCASAQFGTGNKLGNNRFFTYDNTSGQTITVSAQGTTNGSGTAAAVDPDIYIYNKGVPIATGISDTLGTEQADATNFKGIYVVEVFDFNLTTSGTRCMNVSLTVTN